MKHILDLMIRIGLSSDWRKVKPEDIAQLRGHFTNPYNDLVPAIQAAAEFITPQISLTRRFLVTCLSDGLAGVKIKPLRDVNSRDIEILPSSLDSHFQPRIDQTDELLIESFWFFIRSLARFEDQLWVNKILENKPSVKYPACNVCAIAQARENLISRLGDYTNTLLFSYSSISDHEELAVGKHRATLLGMDIHFDSRDFALPDRHFFIIAKPEIHGVRFSSENSSIKCETVADGYLLTSYVGIYVNPISVEVGSFKSKYAFDQIAIEARL